MFARDNGLPIVPMVWIVLAGAFAMHMAYAGVHFSFGVFLKPMATVMDWSRGATAFAYTLMWWTSAPATFMLGWLSDRLGPRRVLLFGSSIFGFGVLLCSAVESLWEFYLYFGVLGGIGRAAARAPLLSAVFQTITKRKGLAVGLTLSGTGFGTLIFPPLTRYIMSVWSWQSAFVVLGVISWVILLPVSFIITRPLASKDALGKAQGEQKGWDADAVGILGSPDKEWTVAEVLKNRIFLVFLGTGLACCVSHSFPLAHMVAYASDRGISGLTAASILGMVGISASAGRLMWGAASDRIGGRKTVLCCIAIQTIMMFLVAFASNLWAFYLFAVAFGLSYGGVLPLYAVVSRELFGMRRFGTVYGMHSFATSMGMGLGGVVGGYTFDFSGDYFVSFMTSTALGLVATGFAAHLAYLSGPGSTEQKTVHGTVAAPSET